MDWLQLAWTVGLVGAVFGVLALVELRARRRFRAALIESARARWAIMQAMPPGEDRNRLALLHGRIVEIADPVWDDLL